jgi:hypothetical protein
MKRAAENKNLYQKLHVDIFAISVMKIISAAFFVGFLS